MHDISIFVGSGASASFGKPTTIEFLRKLQSNNPFTVDPVDRLFRTLLSYRGFPDIEFVLECLKDLAQFKNTQGGSFILNTNNDIRFIADGRDTQIRNLAEHIDTFYEYIVDKLFDFYTITMEDLDLVRKIYSGLLGVFINKRNLVNIFTTNYDLAIEKFGISERINVIDGFEYNASTGMSVWNPEIFGRPPNSSTAQINLYKLHGSLNWANHVQYDFVKLSDNQSRLRGGFMKSNLLIHPTLSPKDEEQREPYKTLIEKFREGLDKSKGCIVIGFSFRDHILNEIFREFLEAGKKLVVISPTCKGDLEKLKLGQVLQLHLVEKYLKEDTVEDIVQDFRNFDIV